VYINKILGIHKFEPKKKYIEELVDTDESDATSVDEEKNHTESEEDDDEVVTIDEIMRVANAITMKKKKNKSKLEEQGVVVDDGKVSCDLFGKKI